MYNAAVITVSDRSYSGEYNDLSGPAVSELLSEHGYTVNRTSVIPDDKNEIIRILTELSDEGTDLIITTGGTGFSKRDVTPEATKDVIERETPGLAEYMRMRSSQITDRAILSRSVCGIRKGSLIINLPGNPKAAVENLSFIINALDHGLDMLKGKKEN